MSAKRPYEYFTCDCGKELEIGNAFNIQRHRNICDDFKREEFIRKQKGDSYVPPELRTKRKKFKATTLTDLFKSPSSSKADATTPDGTTDFKCTDLI